MNKIANSLFQDSDFKSKIESLAKGQHKRRPKAYSAVSLFDAEDIEQEIWCGLFESECIDADTMLKYAKVYAERLARRGDRKTACIEEIPISQLPETQRRYVENLLYSTVGGDEGGA